MRHIDGMRFQISIIVLQIAFGLLLLGCNRETEIASNLPEGSSDLPSPSNSQDSSLLETKGVPTLSKDEPRENGDSNASSGMLIIEIVTEGDEMGGGPLRVALYDGPKTFNKVDLAKWKDVFEVNGQPIKIELETSLFPNNELAIAVYQDSNSNNQLDKNAFGIPQEAYGFSNNPKRGFGPPKYTEVSIPIPTEKLALTIKIQ
ncbi:MAG: DUF2141 domain-containing protein [Pirellula sp.]